MLCVLTWVCLLPTTHTAANNINETCHATTRACSGMGEREGGGRPPPELVSKRRGRHSIHHSFCCIAHVLFVCLILFVLFRCSSNLVLICPLFPMPCVAPVVVVAMIGGDGGFVLFVHLTLACAMTLRTGFGSSPPSSHACAMPCLAATKHCLLFKFHSTYPLRPGTCGIISLKAKQNNLNVW